MKLELIIGAVLLLILMKFSKTRERRKDQEAEDQFFKDLGKEHQKELEIHLENE